MGRPRNPQGSISRVLGTEETEGLPRLGNRPQDSRSKTKTEKNLQPCGLWARLLAGLCLEHTILLYMIQRERKEEQTQPNTQKKRKDADYIIKMSLGRFPGEAARRRSGPYPPPSYFANDLDLSAPSHRIRNR